MSMSANTQQDRIEAMLDGDDTVLRVLAMSWMDAKEYRSVKQNSGQRRALIERAIKEYETLRQDSAVKN